MVRSFPLIFLISVGAGQANTIIGNFVCTTPQDSNGSVATGGATVTALAGCSFGSNAPNIGLEVQDTSTFNMSGGSVQGAGFGLVPDGTGGANSIVFSNGSISGGTYAFEIQGDYGSAGNPGVVISGGTISGSATAGVGLDTLDGSSSVVDVSGGDLMGRDSIRAGSSSTVNISGGSISGAVFGVDAESSAVVNITGGVFTGSFAQLYAQDNAIINIYGTGLSFSGSDIVGTLQSGQTIDDSFQLAGSGQINLINASSTPEPASMLMLGASLLALRVVRRKAGAATGAQNPPWRSA